MNSNMSEFIPTPRYTITRDGGPIETADSLPEDMPQAAIDRLRVLGAIFYKQATVRVTDEQFELPSCGMVRPDTLGYQKCVLPWDHTGKLHKSQDGGRY